MGPNPIDSPPIRMHASLRTSNEASDSLGHREIQLAPYEEVCGEVIALKQDNVTVQVDLSVGTLRYPISSPEAGICLSRLSDHVGDRVSILRVPSQTTPIRIHVPPSATNDTEGVHCE